MKKTIIVIGTTILFLTAVASMFYLDAYLYEQQIKKEVDLAARKFKYKMSQELAELRDTESKLPSPPSCDKAKFKTLLYKHIKIKNIGLIKNNQIICDAFDEQYNEKNIPQSSLLKIGDHYIWKNGDYISIIYKSGYYVEVDTNLFVDFFVSPEVDGLLIYDKFNNNILYSKLTNPENLIIDSNIKELSATLQSVVNSNPSSEAFTTIKNDMLLSVQPLTQYSDIVVFSDLSKNAKQRNEKYWFNLIMGILIGSITSYFYIKIYLQSQTLKSLFLRDLKKKRFFMVYQPLVDIKNGYKIIGFEALVRWRLQNNDMIPPDKFIPMAEENKLTKLLTQLIIDLVLNDLKLILKTHPNLYVAINFTASDLHDNVLVEHIKSRLKDHNLNPSSVVIELTERIATEEKASKSLQELKDSGFRISIDDFGTGASNLKYLAETKPDIVKIDKAFVEWSSNEGPSSQLFEQLVSICKNFDLTIVAEGVETQEQVQRCVKLDVDIGQGYFWYKPLGITEIKSLFK